MFSDNNSSCRALILIMCYIGDGFDNYIDFRIFMQAKRGKNSQEVHILTQRTDMKFIPQIYDIPPSPTQNSSSLTTRLRSLLGFTQSNSESSTSTVNGSFSGNSSPKMPKSTSSEVKEQNGSTRLNQKQQQQIEKKGFQDNLEEKMACEQCKICEKCKEVAQNQGKQIKTTAQMRGSSQKEGDDYNQSKKCSECKICEKCERMKEEGLQTNSYKFFPGKSYVPPKLKFLQMITPQFILIGNKNQLDLINIGSVSTNLFVDTEYYWSFKFHGSIHFVAIDSKKMNVLAIIVDTTLKIYRYDFKKIPKQPFPVFKEIALKETPFCMTMAKDGNICVFYKEHYEIYAVTDQVRKRRDKRYEIFHFLDDKPRSQIQNEEEEGRNNRRKIEILAVPEAYENILNIFFTETFQRKKVFTLWSVELQFQPLQIKNSEPRKIYDIQKDYRSTLILSNYARDIFIMNLKNQINALKPGYVLDSANIIMNHGEEFLNYVGNDTLLHTSKKMIEVYNFSLNMQVKPSRIRIKARDSIKIHSDLKDYQFFKTLPFNNGFVIIFQIKQAKNKNKNGEVSYCLFLTKGISLEEKISLLFPKKGWNFKIGSADLIERCDMAQKMGLSIKEIYLELWNRTEKCKKQDYQILISTNDYQTIKHEILRKLRKTSMPFSQIWKIEQECFLMLQNRVFNLGCTEEAIMEYITCHFFLRKLEMFKDQKYLEKIERDKRKALSKNSQVNEKQNDKEEEGEEKEEDNPGQNSKEGDINNRNDQDVVKNIKKEKQKDLIRITIREYQNLRAMEIKSELLNQIAIYCEQKQQSAIKNIRFLLRTFKFVFRTIYYELLEEIINITQEKLYELLVAIPELLPYSPPNSFTLQHPGYPINFFDGVWPPIDARQWKSSLYVDAISTIDNRQIVTEKILKNLQFRRNYLSQHDMVTISKKSIQFNASKIKSEETFFFFIAKMFKCLQKKKLQKQRQQQQQQYKQRKKQQQKQQKQKQSKSQKQRQKQKQKWNPVKIDQVELIRQIQMKIIRFLEEKYEMMPQNLKGKIFLMYKLYNFLNLQLKLPTIYGRPCTLSEFFQLKDQQFIRHCFVEERSTKGLILKEIKPLYEQVCGQDQGKKLFNEALLKYFASNLSQVSDLKYILNRVNNQKKSFHYENQKMYEILVQAMERKLKIGSESDIPIQEVLIYIENIPFKNEELDGKQSQNKAINELGKINSVKEQIQLLQNAKINMSVYDILNKPIEVITKLVGYLIQAKQLSCADNFQLNEKSMKRVTDSTCCIMAELKFLSDQIYNESISLKKIFFIYLTKLCEKAEMIKHVIHLLTIKFWEGEQASDSDTVMRLVSFLYKFIMSQEKVMINNQFYVNELLQLLPPYSTYRVYLESQMKYAKILSLPQTEAYDMRDYEFPIIVGAYTIVNLRNQLLGLPIDFLISINLQQLHQVISKLQKIYFNNEEEIDGQRQFTSDHFITLHQMYEIIIVQLLHARKLKEVLRYIRKIFQQDAWPHQKKQTVTKTRNNYNIIYLILYIIQISTELTDDNKNTLVACISYYFYYPWELLGILQDLSNTPRSPRQIKEFLEESLDQGKRIKQNQGYDPHNEVFYRSDIDQISNQIERENFMKQLNEATKRMQQSKEQFKDIKYAVTMVILWNSPYALAKLIICSERINVSAIRCFLSYAIKEKVFNRLAVLQVGRRIFQFLLLSQQSLKPIQVVIDQFKNVSLLDHQIQADQEIKQSELKENKLMQMWYKSAQAFRKKKQIIEKQMIKNIEVESIGRKSLNKSCIDSNIDNNEYPFSQFDHDNEEQEIAEIRESQGIKRGPQFKFNAGAEIDVAFDNKKKISLFDSVNEDFRKSGKFTMSIRNRQLDPTSFYHSVGSASGSKSRSSPHNKSPQIELVDSHKIYESLQSPTTKGDRPDEKHRHHQSPEGGVIVENLEESLEMNSDEFEQNNQSRGGSRVIVDDLDRSEEINSGEDIIEQKVELIVNVKEPVEVKLEQKEQSELLYDKGYTSAEEIQQLGALLIDTNMKSLESSHDEYDYSGISNTSTLQELAKSLYQQKPSKVKTSRILKMIKQMAERYPQLKISIQTLDLLRGLAQRWERVISDLPFTQLLPPQYIFHTFQNKDEVFEILSDKLYSYSDSQNIYKVGFFLKTFGNPDYESLLYWDMIMNLCDTLDNLQDEQVNNTLQKIDGILQKASIKIWNQKFEIFMEKVLPSKHKQAILSIFCEHLKKNRGDEAIHFLEQLSSIETSKIVEQTLKEMI